MVGLCKGGNDPPDSLKAETQMDLKVGFPRNWMDLTEDRDI